MELYREQILHIYSCLITLGYPKLLTTKIISDHQYESIKQMLSQYFQCTSSRFHLIQWLIAIIYPSYKDEDVYQSINDQRYKLCWCLWRVGVMPYSKHTKNLNYNSYLQGLLGYENSVDLIYKLCCLAQDRLCWHASKPSNKMYDFVNQLIENYDDLVNVNYDPYGITFPPAYNNLTEQQFDSKYNQICQQIHEQNKNIKQQLQPQQQQTYDNIFQQMQQYKIQFQQKYKQLEQVIQNIIEKYKISLSHYKLQFQKNNKSIKYQNRILKFPNNFNQIYSKYIKLIKVNKLTKISNKIQQTNNTLNNLWKQLHINFNWQQ